jgi:hypothetical protein
MTFTQIYSYQSDGQFQQGNKLVQDQYSAQLSDSSVSTVGKFQAADGVYYKITYVVATVNGNLYFEAVVFISGSSAQIVSFGAVQPKGYNLCRSFVDGACKQCS